MENNIEIRSFNIELKDSENSRPIVSGYAAKYNKQSRLMERIINGRRIKFIEIISPGAFDECISTCDPVALFNHSANELLGTTQGKTLDYGLDETGLYFSLKLPDTPRGQMIQYHMEVGDIKESSFGFRVKKDRWEVKDGIHYRYIEKVADVSDISVVYKAAYADTPITISSLQDVEENPENEVKTKKISKRSFKTDEAEDIYRRQIFLNHQVNLIKIK